MKATIKEITKAIKKRKKLSPDQVKRIHKEVTNRPSRPKPTN